MDDAKTVWCGNISDQVSEELLFELFLQAAPLEKVRIPTDREGRKSNFAFITFKHEVSVNYAQQLLNGTRLFDKPINVKPRNTNSLDRNSARNDYQNSLHQAVSHAELSRLGQLTQHNYEPWSNNYNDNRHQSNYNEIRWEHNYHDQDRHRDNHRSYKKHEYHDNRQNDSPRRRNNYGGRKNNFNDRNSRRNNHY